MFTEVRRRKKKSGIHSQVSSGISETVQGHSSSVHLQTTALQPYNYQHDILPDNSPTFLRETDSAQEPCVSASDVGFQSLPAACHRAAAQAVTGYIFDHLQEHGSEQGIEGQGSMLPTYTSQPHQTVQERRLGNNVGPVLRTVTVPVSSGAYLTHPVHQHRGSVQNNLHPASIMPANSQNLQIMQFSSPQGSGAAHGEQEDRALSVHTSHAQEECKTPCVDPDAEGVAGTRVITHCNTLPAAHHKHTNSMLVNSVDTNMQPTIQHILHKQSSSLSQGFASSDGAVSTVTAGRGKNTSQAPHALQQVQAAAQQQPPPSPSRAWTILSHMQANALFGSLTSGGSPRQQTLGGDSTGAGATTPSKHLNAQAWQLGLADALKSTGQGTLTSAVSSIQNDTGLQSFMEYLQGEASPPPKLPTADIVWGQTERDRVYNFLLYVPYQLERLIQFGTLLCWDSLIAVVTLMPLRALAAVLQLIRPSAWLKTGDEKRRSRLAGNQLYDIMCLLIIITCTAVLRAIKPGFIYYWLKDITSEFLKMSVLSSAFEILDKILSNFGMDVMEALSGTCTLWVAGRRSTSQLLADTLVAIGLTVTHSVTLMCEGLILAVALNSKRQGLLALLIANNFVEIKGAVFKKWDVARIWQLACQDIVERLHLWGVLIFIIVEDMDSSASWRPCSNILWESARILLAEVVIDILKHAVLGKFNDMRPGIYKEYMKDLCEKAVTSQSHALNKLMGFQHLPTACLVLRAVTTLFWLQLDNPSTSHLRRRLVVAGSIWFALVLIKPVLGYALKIYAHLYVQHYNRSHAKPVARPPAALHGTRNPVAFSTALVAPHAANLAVGSTQVANNLTPQVAHIQQQVGNMHASSSHSNIHLAGSTAAVAVASAGGGAVSSSSFHTAAGNASAFAVPAATGVLPDPKAVVGQTSSQLPDQTERTSSNSNKGEQCANSRRRHTASASAIDTHGATGSHSSAGVDAGVANTPAGAARLAANCFNGSMMQSATTLHSYITDPSPTLAVDNINGSSNTNGTGSAARTLRPQLSVHTTYGSAGNLSTPYGSAWYCVGGLMDTIPGSACGSASATPTSVPPQLASPSFSHQQTPRQTPGTTPHHTGTYHTIHPNVNSTPHTGTSVNSHRDGFDGRNSTVKQGYAPPDVGTTNRAHELLVVTQSDEVSDASHARQAAATRRSTKSSEGHVVDVQLHVQNNHSTHSTLHQRSGGGQSWSNSKTVDYEDQAVVRPLLYTHSVANVISGQRASLGRKSGTHEMPNSGVALQQVQESLDNTQHAEARNANGSFVPQDDAPSQSQPRQQNARQRRSVQDIRRAKSDDDDSRKPAELDRVASKSSVIQALSSGIMGWLWSGSDACKDHGVKAGTARADNSSHRPAKASIRSVSHAGNDPEAHACNPGMTPQPQKQAAGGGKHSQRQGGVKQQQVVYGGDGGHKHKRKPGRN